MNVGTERETCSAAKRACAMTIIWRQCFRLSHYSSSLVVSFMQRQSWHELAQTVDGIYLLIARVQNKRFFGGNQRNQARATDSSGANLLSLYSPVASPRLASCKISSPPPSNRLQSTKHDMHDIIQIGPLPPTKNQRDHVKSNKNSGC